MCVHVCVCLRHGVCVIVCVCVPQCVSATRMGATARLCLNVCVSQCVCARARVSAVAVTGGVYTPTHLTVSAPALRPSPAPQAYLTAKHLRGVPDDVVATGHGMGGAPDHRNANVEPLEFDAHAGGAWESVQTQTPTQSLALAMSLAPDEQAPAGAFPDASRGPPYLGAGAALGPGGISAGTGTGTDTGAGAGAGTNGGRHGAVGHGVGHGRASFGDVDSDSDTDADAHPPPLPAPRLRGGNGAGGSAGGGGGGGSSGGGDAAGRRPARASLSGGGGSRFRAVPVGGVAVRQARGGRGRQLPSLEAGRLS